jgi:DNA-binding transcriptional LysR family regulator
MDIDSLDLRKLRTFYFVARFGSLHHAATRMNVSASAVSLTLRRFEEELGIQLFERRPNRLVLTATGRHFFDAAEGIFEGIRKALIDSPLDNYPSGRLSVCINTDIAWYIAPRISAFLKSHPDVDVGIYIKSSSDCLNLVARGELDIGIGRFSKIPGSLSSDAIVESSISLVLPKKHALTKLKEPPLQKIAQYKLVTLSNAHATRAMIDDAFDKAGVTPSSYIEAGNCRLVCDFVAAGIGVGLVHTICTQQAVSADLRYRDLRRHLGKGTFSMIYQKKNGANPVLLNKFRNTLLALP